MIDETGKVEGNLKVDMAARANLFWIALLVSLAGGGIYFMVENTERLLTGISMFGLSLLLFSSMEDDRGAPKLWLKIFERFASASTVVLILAAVICALAATWL